MKILYYILGVIALLGCLTVIFSISFGIAGIISTKTTLMGFLFGAAAFSISTDCMKDIERWSD
jgi:hypothetical protein